MTVQQYNRMIEEYNRKVRDQIKRNIDQYNREVRRVNDANKRSVDNYNNQVRQFNNNQRQNLERAIRSFNQTRLVTYKTTIVYQSSVKTLGTRYTELEDYNHSHHISNSQLLIDYPVQETNNSVQLFNSLSGSDQGDYLEPRTLQLTEVEGKLYNVSAELGKRWEGAIFSLNPSNPDAARHFCTSVREVFIQLFDIKAPDISVLKKLPNCVLRNGKPTRREKIRYLLSMQSIINQPMVAFVDADVEDLMTLFQTLNDGTHGSAGTFTVQQLLKLKKRAEDAILFITELNQN